MSTENSSLIRLCGLSSSLDRTQHSAATCPGSGPSFCFKKEQTVWMLGAHNGTNGQGAILSTMHETDALSRRTFLGMAGVALALGADADPVIDIHQHTDYSGRTDEQLLAHQRTMGITRTVLLPAGSRFGLAAGAGGNDSVVAVARANPKEYVFFANELPDIPETKAVIEKYLKGGAIGIGEQKFHVECDSKAMQLIAD